MKSVYERRRVNLRELARQWGGPTSLAKKLKHANGSFLAQLIGPNPTREVSEKVAREMESALRLPQGWLDDDRSGMQSVVDDDLLATCVRAVATELRDAGRKPDPDRYATLVALVYDHARLGGGRLDESAIKKLISLLGG